MTKKPEAKVFTLEIEVPIAYKREKNGEIRIPGLMHVRGMMNHFEAMLADLVSSQKKIKKSDDPEETRYEYALSLIREYAKLYLMNQVGIPTYPLDGDNPDAYADQKCSICDDKYYGYGNNAEPVNSGRCCDTCNITKVVPARLKKSK